MGPRRYVAQNPADALKQIRLELGPEAVVLSNREVDDGVEIVAIRPEDLASMSGERSVVAPNSEGAPFAALPMPASPRAASEAPPASRGRASPENGWRLSGSLILDQHGKCEAVLSRGAWGLLCILWRKPG